MRQIAILRHALIVLPTLWALIQAVPCAAQTVPDCDGKCDTGALVDGTTPDCTLRAAVDAVNALATGYLHSGDRPMKSPVGLCHSKRCAAVRPRLRESLVPDLPSW